MKEKGLAKESATKPVLKGIVWIHSITTMLFVCVPVFVSGIAGEQLTDDLYITGIGLVKYCSVAIIAIVSPLLNAVIYGFTMNFKRKLMLYHGVAIVYGAISVYVITQVLPEIQASVDFPVTIDDQAIYLPITYIVNSLMTLWIEFRTKKWKEKKDE